MKQKKSRHLPFKRSANCGNFVFVRSQCAWKHKIVHQRFVRLGFRNHGTTNKEICPPEFCLEWSPCRKCQSFVKCVVCLSFQIAGSDRRLCMDWLLVSLVDPLLARAEGVAEHGDAPHQDEDQAHPVEHAELRKH